MAGFMERLSKRGFFGAGNRTVNHSLRFLDSEAAVKRTTTRLIGRCISQYNGKRKYKGRYWEQFLLVIRRFRCVDEEENVDI